MKSNCVVSKFVWTLALVGVVSMMLVASDASAVRRTTIVGDSWPMFMIADDGPNLTPINRALMNKGLDIENWSGAGMGSVAIGGSEIAEWAYSTGLGTGALARTVQLLQDNPTIDIVILTLGGNDFLGRWRPTSTPEQVEQIWYEARYGADGQGGLKKIFDTLLAVRPDIKIIFSSYDYIGIRDGRILTMDDVQAYNEANELYTRVIIDFVNDEYKNPPRAFVVNNLGLMQYVFGYPGPNPETIPSYFWPVGPPATPHEFRFGPGEAPLFPGNEASGYLPLAGGDPDFRISPYAAQLDPPIDGWIHLNPAGYTKLLENVIDQYVLDWLDYPKVYEITRASRNPLSGLPVTGPVGFDEVAFEVTFSEWVTGVDHTDFEAIQGGGLSGASVVDVQEAKDGASYIVTVNSGAGDGSLGLAVVDNNTIVDGEGNPLGGPLGIDGYFAYGESYEVDRSIGMPVAAFPFALALLGIGALVARRRS